LPVRIWLGYPLADKLHLQCQGESILLGKLCLNAPMIRLPHRPACGPSAVGYLRVVVGLVLVSAGYYALAVVGTVLSVPPSNFAIIWPATAFLVTVLLLTPTGHWWIYLVALLPTHFHMVYRYEQTDTPVLVILCQIGGNFALAIATTFAVRLMSKGPLRFDNFQSLLKFILVAGVLVPGIVNALILCLFLWIGWATDFWISWRQWMLASVFPTVTIPPMLVMTFRRELAGYRTDTAKYYAELVILIVALLAVCILVFEWEHPQPEYVQVLLLAPLPFLLWAAIRLAVGGTSLALLIFAGGVAASALAGRGPFAMSAPIENVLSVQVFLITVSIPLLLLAALVEERARASASLRLSEQRLLTLQQEEHQRIAEVLHSSTAQHLTAMALHLMSLKSMATQSPGTAQTIEDIETSLKEATRELRSFSYLLHPMEVQRDGLFPTLQRYLDGFAMRTRLQAQIRASSGIDDLPLALQEALMRVVQEALANTYRHASASKVVVKFSRVRRRLHLVIHDDGGGFPRDSRLPKLGVGIPGMRARMRQFGGTLDFRTGPRGTFVHAVVPLNRQVEG
jgi:signal transduction histidine kinase